MEGLRTRRAFLAGTMTAAAAVAVSSCAPPQAAKRIPQLGYIAGPATSPVSVRVLDAFREGLRDRGYVEPGSVRIEVRYCRCSADVFGGQSIAQMTNSIEEEILAFGAELERLRVDVLVAADIPWQTAVRLPRTVPVLAKFDQDPSPSDAIASLARPGGNVTGILDSVVSENAKRFELLREMAPDIRRVGAITSGGNPGSRLSLKGAQEAARALRIDVDDLAFNTGDLQQFGLRRILDRAVARGVDSFLVGPATFVIQERTEEIVAYALERRMPLAATSSGTWADAGALVTFGSDVFASQRRLTYFVDRILKGTRPGDIPIEQPSEYETIVNLTTARAIGVSIPQAVLARATRVIQ